MVNDITEVAGSGQKDQLRRQLRKRLDGVAARLHRRTAALSTEVDGGKQARRLHIALTRLDDAEYGVCSECGARIPQKRLLAVPDAATCVSCQDRLEHYSAQMNREPSGRGVLS